MANGILLQSGEFYDYENLSSNKFTVHDIALSLSNICRYGGQVDKFYSVAQHSVLCALNTYSSDHMLDALMHDAAEAFLGDIPTPLKQMLPDYKALEAKHEADIFMRLGLAFPMHSSVQRVDRRALATEVYYLKPSHSHWNFLDEEIFLNTVVKPMKPKKAYRQFMEVYIELTGKTGHEIL